MATAQNPDGRALVETLAKALVDAPDQVSVEPFEDEDGTEFSLTVAENDLGRVIGRGGRTARCLRSILHAAGVKAHSDYTLEIVED